MEEEVVAIYQARQREKEVKDGAKPATTGNNKENEDENLLQQLKGSPMGVGTLEEVRPSSKVTDLDY